MIKASSNAVPATIDNRRTRTGSSKRYSEARVKTLRQVTYLFLHDADRLNDEQVKVFDEVICLLASRIESRNSALNSANALPPSIMRPSGDRRLARDNEIGVARTSFGMKGYHQRPL